MGEGCCAPSSAPPRMRPPPGPAQPPTPMPVHPSTTESKQLGVMGGVADPEEAVWLGSVGLASVTSTP